MRVSATLFLLAMLAQAAPAQPSILWTTEDGLHEAPTDGSGPARLLMTSKHVPGALALDEQHRVLYWSHGATPFGTSGSGTVYRARVGVDEQEQVYEGHTFIQSLTYAPDTHQLFVWHAKGNLNYHQLAVVDLESMSVRSVELPANPASATYHDGQIYVVFEGRLHRAADPFSGFDPVLNTAGDTVRANVVASDPSHGALALAQGGQLVWYDLQTQAERLVHEQSATIRSLVIDARRDHVVVVDQPNFIQAARVLTLNGEQSADAFVIETTRPLKSWGVDRATGHLFWVETPEDKGNFYGTPKLTGVDPATGEWETLVPWFYPDLLAYDAHTDELSFVQHDVAGNTLHYTKPLSGEPVQLSRKGYRSLTIASGAGWQCATSLHTSGTFHGCSHPEKPDHPALRTTFPVELEVAQLRVSDTGCTLYRMSRPAVPPNETRTLSTLVLDDTTATWAPIWNTTRDVRRFALNEFSNTLYYFDETSGCAFSEQLGSGVETGLFCLNTANPTSPRRHFDVDFESKRIVWWSDGALWTSALDGSDQREVYRTVRPLDLVIRHPRRTGVSTESDPVPALSSLAVYPQPANTQATFELPVDTAALTVYDLQGRRVARMEHPSRRERLNTSAWPAGVYVVQAETAGRVLTQKLVITR
ncbi:MAG: T9SS type A sorting domain-containing protein [Bacteroidota bacterium]